jgi:hypothetical protein
MRLTNLERNGNLSQYTVLSQAISEGKWDYSPSKLRQEFQAYQFLTWFEVHHVTAKVTFIFLILAGLLPMVVIGVALAVQRAPRERFAEHLVKLKNNRLFHDKVA